MRLKNLVLGLLGVLCLFGCAMPRVIVLEDPLDARGHNDLGVAYQQRGESDLALREYERAAELDRRWARPLINRGNLQAAEGEWRKAQKSYFKALDREPDNAEAMNNLAWVLLRGGESGAALSWAEKSVAGNPLEPVFLDTLAEARIACGDYDGARQAIAEALALDPPPELRQSLEQMRAMADR